ncbi:tRNA 2-thiouridine(34) synthase MnmA [Myxococcota bacterium]|nr:tRNA 2-thiouridine(34) synthase MnmA [Myxococcota bacterium]
MSDRVVVAMSGGVDSSVAAALVAREGREAIGVTMHLAGSTSRCCSLEDADDARQVARNLGMRFFVANYKDRFRSEVMESFADEYLAGRTPIPCVMCNSRFKFEYLLDRAGAFGAEEVASGHYARTRIDPETGLWQLLKAVDTEKDQTYFLFELRQDQLCRVQFPLGEMTKPQVRDLARDLGLTTSDKPESQEICFVPDGDYAAAVERIRPDRLPGSGEIVDQAGRVRGRHRGIHRFTVGQRRGLKISDSRPLYVSRIDAGRNRVVVGGVESLQSSTVEVDRVNWISGNVPESPLRAVVRVRYRHEGAPARVEPTDRDRVRIYFDNPVRAVAPGQAAVFYQGESVLGGGWIRGSVG